jgi:ectoine hydroxylase-related dioxygenase (phytanoyl-CoA dioxygenase family)
MSAVTSEQIREFVDDGFVKFNQVFSADEVDAIAAAFDRVHAMAEELAASGRVDREGQTIIHNGAKFTFQREAADGWSVRHIAWCGAANETLDRFGRDRRLLAIAAGLLDSPSMHQLINQAHYKKPGTSVAFAWHQDSTFRGIGTGEFDDINGRGSYVQTVIAVDAATPENGPLQFIPGSSRLGHLDLQADYDAGGLENDGQPFDVSTAVTPLLKRGDVVAFGPYTIHGSGANRSNQWRRAFINGFAYPGANHKPPYVPDVGRELTMPS